MIRGFWFLAGAASGVYAMIRARRAADALTPEGLRDRVAGLSLGAALFTDEVRTHMAAKENELRTMWGLGLDGRPELPGSTGHPAAPIAPHTHELSREGKS